MSISCRSVFCALLGCGILFWPLDRVSGQDPMDHVDLTSDEMTKASVAGLDLSGADVSGAYLVQLIGKDKIIGLDKVNNLAEAEIE